MGMALLVVVSAGVIGLVPKFRKPHAHRWDLETPGPARSSPGSTDGARNARVNEPQDSSLNPLSQVGARIGQLRRKFIIEYPDAGSNIDSDVQLGTTADLIRYLPRATVIGFFAPFPNMWLATGNQVGSSGRLMSGLETMVMYAVEVLAIVALWGARKVPGSLPR